MSTWHAPPDLLTRYGRQPAAVDDVTASSIEQHLLACADCRALLAEAVEPTDLERSWLEVADAVDRPRASGVERLLGRLGIAEDTARLVGATGALQAAWLGVVVLFAVLAMAAAGARGEVWPFLVLAPLLPVGGVALAFLPVADPAGETGVATPLHGLGVAVRRVLATLAPTLVLLAAASPLLPDEQTSSGAWLLPALALTATTLLGSTLVRVPVAAGSSAGAWFVALYVVRAFDRRGPFDRTEAFGPTGQLVAVVVLCLATLGLVLRRDRFTTMEVHW